MPRGPMRRATSYALVTAAVTAVMVAAPAVPSPSPTVAAPQSMLPPGGSAPARQPAVARRDVDQVARASRASRADPAPVRRPPARCQDEPPTARGQRALASLRPQWRASRVPLSFLGPRSGLLGETAATGDVRVFVRRCAEQSDALLRHVIGHELGHAWDFTRLTPAQRVAYLRARRIPVTTPWYGCSGCSDFATPAGDFAETYSLWLRRGTATRSELAPTPTPRELADLARRFFGG